MWESFWEPRKRDIFSGNILSDIERCRFSLNIRIRRDDDFLYSGFFFHSLKQML